MPTRKPGSRPPSAARRPGSSASRRTPCSWAAPPCGGWRDDLAAGDERGGVVDAGARVFGKADHDAASVHLLAHPLQAHLDLAPEAAMEQQILRRIARERQLRETAPGPHPARVRAARASRSRASRCRARRRPAGRAAPVRFSTTVPCARPSGLPRRCIPRGSPRIVSRLGAACRRAGRRAGRALLRRRRARERAAAAAPSPSPARRETSPCARPRPSNASYLSAAVPLPPATIAPAWPMRLPGGAVTPAM